MGVEMVLAIVGFAVGVLLTPLYVYLIVKGVQSLRDIRDLLGRPPGDYGLLRHTRRGPAPRSLP